MDKRTRELSERIKVICKLHSAGRYRTVNMSVGNLIEVCDRLDRLVAYEDTGLTPEEIEELKVIKWWSQCGTDDMLPTVWGIPVDRLRALAEADRDGQCVILNEPVSNFYKSEMSKIGELLEDAAEKIEDRCREWLCIYQRASNDADKIKGDVGLTAYRECLQLVDFIGQKCAEAESALGKEIKNEK